MVEFRKAFLAPILFLLLSPVALSDAVKWVDEQGHVHFGDRPPDNQKVETEAVELKEAPKTGMTEAELAEQRKRVNSYKAEVQRQEYLERQPQTNSDKNTSPAPNSTKRVPNREECRNMHPSKTADRVRCFQEAERSSGES